MKRSFKLICAFVVLLGSALVVTGLALLFPDYTCIRSNAGDCASPFGGPLIGIGAAVIVLTLAVWIHAGVRSSVSIPKGATNTGVIRMRGFSVAGEDGRKEIVNVNMQVSPAVQERPWFKFGTGPRAERGGNTNGKQPCVSTTAT